MHMDGVLAEFPLSCRAQRLYIMDGTTGRGDRQCRRRGGTFKQHALARIKAWALVKIKALI
ncbi:hypothetical protein M422DRAFT_39396 [Sphaerobolus stellatus SS14]|uniref:Uncharacterized protein n=1 Tax=Sphaerobolus stellatus (strain SS14) TaxID=990650 RepID=A0A0C9UEJ0_SPHS4|nr:hypothetical protein M422DRAFT_39396 [Sphaerobolus stellatus SS14]